MTKLNSYKILFVTAFIIANNNCYAQWFASSPPVNTYTTTTNVGIGLDPLNDARLKILNNCTNSPGGNPDEKIPAILVQRNLLSPLVNGFPIANVMEVWKQDYSTMPPTGPLGPNSLRFVIDGEGNVGINKQPIKSLDIAEDANVDKTLTVGGVAGTSSLIDVLTVSGNITFTRPVDGQYRNIRARTSDGALAFLANTAGEDGPAIVLNGKTNTAAPAGAISFSCYGAAGNTGFEFNNYDPSTTNWNSRMHITTDGKVVIGASSLPTPSGYNLYVDSGILTKKIKVALPSDPTNWSDFVFSNDYKLRSLSDLESFITKHNHLPEIPSTAEVHKDGLDLAQMDAKLLQKIEELTLYVIEQQKEIETLKRRK